MDITATGIAIGICGVVIFAVIQLIRQRTFDVINSVLVFLALFTIPLGVDLLRAAFIGDEKNLPTSWREYLAVAAAVGIGLAFSYIVRAFKSVWRKPILSNDEQKDGGQKRK